MLIGFKLIKEYKMNIQARKLNLIQEFLRITDENIISDLELFIKKARINAYESELKPMTLEEFNNMINLSVSESELGQTIPQEELLESIKLW